ncbi:lactonase family protein [Cohnella ginsengisoli]|uniref:Lactonase family protein n=1 Tax=Cohnella ginsengisoli TaxID=425004 RepID=A0A9X4KFD4_9BACL|nr:lactonase family protein [Cohnella ginsengisoli]MDG0790961.1 lactonase family protein [Cohnella ginsengisoli]
MSQSYAPLFVGSYQSADREGIHILRLDAESGSLSKLGGVAGIDNPSFLAYHAESSVLYAVSETDPDGGVVAYAYDAASHALTEINRQPSQGGAPCHLAIDPSGGWLILVNYTGGNISLYPIGDRGALGEPVQSVAHEGSSINAERQEGPHPHSIYAVPGTSYYLACDLGTDKIYTYRLDAAAGRLEAVRETNVTPGSGPRHLALHPTRPFVYLIDELMNRIVAFKLDADEGSLDPLQTVSTLPEGYGGESYCAEVAVSADGKYVYGSNRGHDSIVSFRVGEDGGLSLVGHTPSGGHFPRHFLALPDGRWLLAANQNGDNIVVMRVDEDGFPRHAGSEYKMTKPVCVRLG